MYGERFVRLASSADEQIFAFDRGNVRVLLNLSDEAKTFTLENASFEGYESYMQNGFSENTDAATITLEKWGYAVFLK